MWVWYACTKTTLISWNDPNSQSSAWQSLRGMWWGRKRLTLLPCLWRQARSHPWCYVLWSSSILLRSWSGLGPVVASRPLRSQPSCPPRTRMPVPRWTGCSEPWQPTRSSPAQIGSFPMGRWSSGYMGSPRFLQEWGRCILGRSVSSIPGRQGFHGALVIILLWF